MNVFLLALALLAVAAALHAVLLRLFSRWFMRAPLTWRRAGLYSALLCTVGLIVGVFLVGLIGAGLVYLILATTVYGVGIRKHDGQRIGLGGGFVLAMAIGLPVWAGCVAMLQAAA